jgi:F-type H+-transporting ATPase subunit b
MVVLNAIFFKPLTKVLEERSDYIRANETEARDRLSKAQALAQQYEQELAETRRQYQATIASAQEEAKRMAADQIASAQREAQAQREQAQQELDKQRQEALQALEQQVESLSGQILNKLLPTA